MRNPLPKSGVRAVLALVTCMVMALSAEAKTLRVTSQIPPSHPITANLFAFKEIVEEESGGNLTIEIFHSAQLYKDKEVPKAVASGAIDMGTASLTRFAGTIPAVDLFYVPFLLSSNDAAMKATERGHVIRDTLDAEILATGARVLWWQAVGGAIFMSKDKIEKPEDIKGLKVRVFGKTLGKFVEVLGGAPSLISGSEQFLAYQRGTVDAGMSLATSIKPRRIYEVLDHITLTNHASAWFVVIINEKVWQGLSDGERALLSSAGARVSTDMRNSLAQAEEDSLEFVRRETKMGITELSPSELDAWKAASEPVVDHYVQNAGELGARLVKAAKELK